MTQTPPLLNIQLKRFAFSATNQNVKLNHYVKFPLEINLAKYSATDTMRAISNDETYQLYGIIVHTGPSADIGHYFCYVRSPQNSQWYKMDDTSVQKVNEKEVLAAKAYLQQTAPSSIKSSSSA